jgi:hypothetical protein
LAITVSMCQSIVMEGVLRASITILESPSRENLVNFKKASNEVTS